MKQNTAGKKIAIDFHTNFFLLWKSSNQHSSKKKRKGLKPFFFSICGWTSPLSNIYFFRSVCRSCPLCRRATLRFVSGVWFHLKWSRAAQKNSPVSLKVSANTKRHQTKSVMLDEKVHCEWSSHKRFPQGEENPPICVVHLGKLTNLNRLHSFWKLINETRLASGLWRFTVKVRSRQKAQREGEREISLGSVWTLSAVTLLDTCCDLYSRSSEPPHRLDTWQRHWTQRATEI